MLLLIRITVLIICTLLSGFIQAREVLVVTVDWPPYYTQTLPEQGPFSAITRAAFKVKGHTIKITFLPWKRAFWEVNYGRADMVLGAFYTEDRAKIYAYSDSIYAVREHVIGLKSNNIFSFNTLNDLKEYTFGTTLGYAYSKEFDAATYLLRKNASSDYLNIKKLFDKSIDFVVMTPGVFKAALSQIPEQFRKEYVLLTPPLSVSPIHNLFSKKNSDSLQLVEDFNFGLKEIQKNGVYHAILKRFNLKYMPLK